MQDKSYLLDFIKYLSGKDYLGHYLKEDQINLNQLKIYEDSIKTQVIAHCAPHDLAVLTMCTFAQVFVA